MRICTEAPEMLTVDSKEVALFVYCCPFNVFPEIRADLCIGLIEKH